ITQIFQVLREKGAFEGETVDFDFNLYLSQVNRMIDEAISFHHRAGTENFDADELWTTLVLQGLEELVVLGEQDASVVRSFLRRAAESGHKPQTVQIVEWVQKRLPTLASAEQVPVVRNTLEAENWIATGTLLQQSGEQLAREIL